MTRRTDTRSILILEGSNGRNASNTLNKQKKRQAKGGNLLKTYKKPLRKKIEELEIDVLGFPYQVKFVEDLIKRFNITGCANVWGDEIQIDPDVTNLDVISCIFHEIIEVMMRKTETKCEHELISRFETFLMMILIRNPELVELALDVAKKEGKSLKNSGKKAIKALVRGCKGKSRI